MDNSPFKSFPRIRLQALQKNINLTMTRLFRARGYDITREQEVILRELCLEDGVNQADLAARVGQDRNNLSRTLTILDSKKLVEREADPKDRRNTIVRITEAGRALHKDVYESINEYRMILFDGFSPEEVESFSQMVQRLNANLEGFLHREDSAVSAPRKRLAQGAAVTPAGRPTSAP